MTYVKKSMASVIALAILAVPPHAWAQTESAEPAAVAAMPAPSVDEAVPQAAAPSTLATAEPAAPETAPAAAGAVPAAPEPEVVALVSPRIKVTYSRADGNGKVTKEEMDMLRVVRPKETQAEIGKQVVLNVALVLLTGGAALNATGFSKEDLMGVDPEGAVDTERLKNPGLVQLPTVLEQRVTDWLASQDKTRDLQWSKGMVVHSATWRLVYEALDGSSDAYKLQFVAGVHKVRENPSLFSGSARSAKTCTYTSAPRPMNEWKEADYQAVANEAPLAADYCAKEFMAQLPTMLELQ
ncbi:hypothetical protein AAFF27_03530 [Xylophilus sp. GW821-FHT01B05]